MSRRATIALSTMAASVEGKQSSTPSQEAMAAIEDVLSVTKSVSFFGAATKTYKITRDSNSGAFCTVPVKYAYKDKDTRIRVETILRSRCKVNCSTPYPPILRECIRKTIDAAKLARPTDFVRVHVDAINFALKLAWRPKESSTWVPYEKPIPLPMEALDISSKKIPDGLAILDPPPPSKVVTPTRNGSTGSRKSPNRMEQGSPPP